MSDNLTYLYHCDRCGGLFKAQKQPTQDIKCEICGQHPVRPKFSSVSEQSPLSAENIDHTRGIPGKDAADIFSMNKAKRNKRWLLFGIGWICAIIIVAFIAYRTHKEATLDSQANVELSDEDKFYLIRKNRSLIECSTRFNAFKRETDIDLKKNHILNPQELVSDMYRHYENSLSIDKLKDSELVSYDYVEENKSTRLKALYKYKPRKNSNIKPYAFEVLFLKSQNKWLINWPHLVRLGDTDWFTFVDEKRLNSPQRFRVYARSLSSDLLTMNGFTKYRFSEAINNHSNPNRHAQTVFVKTQSIAKTKLKQAITEKKNENNKASQQFKFDPINTIRVDVILDHEVINGETVIVLKKLNALDWKSPAPSIK